jgi:hypothetical protein
MPEDQGFVVFYFQGQGIMPLGLSFLAPRTMKENSHVLGRWGASFSFEMAIS